LGDIGSLALFARVVRARSFSFVARDLGLAKSAVSKRLRVLEEKVGARLLTRTTRQVAPTPDGARLYEHCASIMTALELVERELETGTTSAQGSLRVSAPTVLAERYIVPLIGAFFRAHPGVNIELTAEDRIVDVGQGGFDLAIRIVSHLE